MLLTVKFCIAIFFISCVSCFASTHVVEEDIQISSSIARLSDREKEWYQRFQNGLPFFNGWKQISQDIINKFPVADRKAVKEDLKILGKKIGTEWCRENKVRKIDTEMLRRWGGMINKAVERGKKHLVDTIRAVEQEVDEILVNKLASSKE